MNGLTNGNGHPVARIGLGTWQLGGTEWGEVSDDKALLTLQTAAECGMNFIDTADIYGGGRSESLIGKFLAGNGRRDDFYIATKFGRSGDPGWPDNFRGPVIRQHVEGSLQRLQTDHVDLLQCHCIPMEHLADGVVWETLRDLKKEGKISAFGASVESMDEAIQCIEVPGLSALQIIFNPFRLKPAEFLFHPAREKGIALIARLPLASGLLSGKLGEDTVFPESDHRNFNRDGQRFNVGETFAGLELRDGIAAVEKLKELVPQNVSMVQWALRWALDHEEISVVIPGSRKPEQVRENAGALALKRLPGKTHAAVFELYHEFVRDRIRGVY